MRDTNAAVVLKMKDIQRLPLEQQVLEIDQLLKNANLDYADALRRMRQSGLEKVQDKHCPENWSVREKEFFVWEARLFAEPDEELFETWLRDGSRSKDGLSRSFMRNKCQRLRKEKERASRTGVSALGTKAVELYQADIREVKKLKFGTADAIITDPPYPEEYLPLWSELVHFAGRTLRDRGWLVAMSGQHFLPEVFAKMNHAAKVAGLQYVHTLCVRTPGGQSASIVLGNGPHPEDYNAVNSAWKPVIVYSKGQPEKWPDKFQDVVTSDENDKEYDEWGQSVSVFNVLVEKFTKAKDLVVDPFLGGGTTAVSAYEYGRRIEGFDIDKADVQCAIKRVQLSQQKGKN